MTSPSSRARPPKAVRAAPVNVDPVAAVALVLFAMAIAARSLPNLDLWWMLAVGRRIVETHAYIHQDPFSFSLPGAPWSPQSYASAIVFFLLYKIGGMAALTVLRVVLVGALVALTLRTLRFIGASWAISAPLVVVALLTAHARFTDRGQVFEYVFVAWLLGFLLTAHERRGRSFFVAPVLVQLAWVQLHSSFLLGPVLATAFFAAEAVASRVPGLQALARHPWKRVTILLGLLALACLINPSPRAFLIQPFDPVHRELLSRYTLEWKSPFDPAIASGNFHPWFEILLGAAAAAIVLNLARLPLAPVVLLVATAWLAFQSHRFRVEFALVAVPMIALLIRQSAWLAGARAAISRSRWIPVAGLLLAVAIMIGTRDRALESHDLPELYPEGALRFIAEHDVAHRPFHTIGFGSYLLWDQYGVRKSFIDGRNYDSGLYRDFLDAQTNVAGWRRVVEKYRLDAFIVPSAERADAGMQNVHRALIAGRGDWDLVFIDDAALVYVSRAAADSSWLATHALRHYHPMTFGSAALEPEEAMSVTRELERLATATPPATQVLADLGVMYYSQQRYDDAIAVFEALAARTPRDTGVFLNLTRVYAVKGDLEGALRACERALAIEPGNARALEMKSELRGRLGY